MNPPTQTLQTQHIHRCRRSVILVFLPTIFTRTFCARGNDVVDVSVLYAGIDVDVVGVEEDGVVEGFEEGGREFGGEERVLVGSLVAADLRVDFFLLEEHPVEEGAGEGGDGDGGGVVDGWVVRELAALDEVEDYGVFETTGGVSFG